LGKGAVTRLGWAKWSLLGLLAVGALVVSAASGATIAKPKVLLSPPGGPPTTSFSIAGTGFAPGETLAISWDGGAIASETADASGAFSDVQAQAPVDAQPGNHQVVVTGRSSGRTAQRAFLVRTNWTQAGFSAGNSRYNNYENVLSPANVSGLTLGWKSGTGELGQPIVAYGRVYAIATDGSLHALDAATGSELWATAAGLVAGVPAYGAHTVYGSGNGGQLYAFDAASGQLRWTAATLGSTSPWGAGWWPVFNAGRVYLSVADALNGLGRLYAFDAASGSVIWSAAADSGHTFSPPAVTGSVVYAIASDLGSGDAHASAFDAVSGAPRWVGPAYYDDIGSPAAAGRRVYAPGREGDTAVVFRASTGAILGEREGARSAAVGNGVGYSINDDGLALLSAWSEDTGSVLWRRGDENDPSETDPFFPSAARGGMALANGVLYVPSDYYGALYALDAATGRTLAKVSDGTLDHSSPIVADGVVYVSGGGNIEAFSLPAAN
jgi:outer membrane protein assembly factor BamB